MSFPEHIERVFDTFGVPPETKAAVYDLYVSMGEEALDVFGEIAEGVTPSNLRPEHCASIRSRVVERYLERNHPLWSSGRPTASFYRPRALEGRAAGLALPLGPVRPQAHQMIGGGQPVPEGILMQGRNAHFGGRQETISFDLIAAELSDAVAIGKAEGQQHTLPGSVGETSGSLDGERSLALLWEIQPNVYKPVGDRNRSIAKIYRRHRNWHIITLVAALEWLRANRFRVYVVRGEALAATHEVNKAKPVSPAIVALHNRTVTSVTSGMEMKLLPASRDDEMVLLESSVMNTGLSQHVSTFGAAGAVWRVE